MWRSSAAAALVVLLAAAPSRADVCLPPLYEDGSRLVSATETRVLWLEPLLRQHEVCRRNNPGEKRVFVIGSSGIFGYPHPATETAVSMVNRSFDDAGAPAHLFNLGMMWTYAAKDALILHEAERFHPDVVVYAVTLDDFYHSAPAGFTPVDNFFLRNSRAVDRAAKSELAGIGAPLELYRRYWSDDVTGESWWRSLRESGRLARIGARQVALRARAAWFPDLPGETAPIETPEEKYDCAEVHRFALHWIGWKEWSLLPWLERIQRERGTRVLVVNWPVAADPVGDCFNARYPSANFADYNAWLREETTRRGLAYLDLHDLLRPDDFLDSIHPNLEGQRTVAARLETALRDVLSLPTSEER